MQQAVKYRTPLRAAKRDLIRGRIRNAARKIFFEKHFDTATMDEIAAAAGLRRSTLYLHYKDKGEILFELITDYGKKAKRLLATLPGSDPTLAQVRGWVGKVARFIAREQMPLSIIVEIRRRQAYSAEMEELTEGLLASLAQGNPRFGLATGPSADPVCRARALLLLQDLTYACETHLEDRADPCGLALLEVVARNLHEFLTN